MFNLFAIDLSESLSFDSISELSIPSFLDQTITRAITPAEGHSWNKSNLICYISPTISSLYGSGVYNAIKAGANGWSSTNAPSISITSNILSYDISIDMGDCGTTGWDGISNYYWIGNYYTLSDIQLNTTYLIDYLSNTGLWQAMTCHEMGHSLGLDHNTTTTSIMQPNTVDYYDYRDGDPNIKTPRVVDRAGMNAIYS